MNTPSSAIGFWKYEYNPPSPTVYWGALKKGEGVGGGVGEWWVGGGGGFLALVRTNYASFAGNKTPRKLY